MKDMIRTVSGGICMAGSSSSAFNSLSVAASGEKPAMNRSEGGLSNAKERIGWTQ